MSKTAAEHKERAPTSIRFAVITVSTSRFERLKRGKGVEDPSGQLIVRLLEEAGHSIAIRKVIGDKAELIRGALLEALETADAIVTCGGTGVSPSDVTIETVNPMLEKELPGFGEILRSISFDQVGSASLLTRAIAGVVRRKPIFCLPGSPQAVETALKRLIIPEVGHIVVHAKEPHGKVEKLPSRRRSE